MPDIEPEFDSVEAKIADLAMHYINVRTNVFRLVTTQDAMAISEAISDAVTEVLSDDV